MLGWWFGLQERLFTLVLYSCAQARWHAQRRPMDGSDLDDAEALTQALLRGEKAVEDDASSACLKCATAHLLTVVLKERGYRLVECECTSGTQTSARFLSVKLLWYALRCWSCSLR